MWREWTTHKHKETRFLSEVIAGVLDNCLIGNQVAVALRQGQKEALFSRFLKKFGRVGLERGLAFLYAVVSDQVKLSEIEELNREKIFCGEVDEAEETMGEKVASLEVFILARGLGRLESEQAYATQMAAGDFRQVLTDLSTAFRLNPSEAEEVFHLIILHEKIIDDFSRAPSAVSFEYLIKFCQKHRRDADDFLDLLLVAIFLAAIIDGRDAAKVFLNFLAAEHAFAPGRRADRLVKRAEQEKRLETARWRQAGLDGQSLLKLLGMKPGPKFGKILFAVQAFAKGRAEMPKFSAEVENEILKRVYDYHATRSN